MNVLIEKKNYVIIESSLVEVIIMYLSKLNSSVGIFRYSKAVTGGVL